MSNSFPGGLLTTGADTSYSVALNGSSDYLTWSGSTVGTSQFTFECWFYYTGTFASIAAFVGPGSAVTNALNLYINNSTQLTFDQYGITATSFTVPTMVANKWYHVAFVRGASNACTVFLDGVRSSTGTSTISTNYADIASIGYVSSAVPRYFPGFLSNVRYTKSAVYNPNVTSITVPTQFFPSGNPELLTCQSPTLIDDSTNNYTITAVSGAKVSNFTPFAGYKGFNPALGAAAGGVWTLEQATSYQSNRTWPIYDPYFNQTTLLLHGQGTNGANNSSFVDSSSNNFALTRNGNATQGSFSPFATNGWSNYFDGSDDRLITSSSILGSAYGSGGSSSALKSTIEAMVYLNKYGSAVSDSDDTAIISKGSTYGNFCILDDGRLMWYHFDGSLRTPTSTGIVPLNAWTHVAATISNGVVTFYVNGAAVGTGTWYGMSQTSDPVYIGEATGASAQSLNGYLSNLRVSSIVRTITVPTAPYVADAYTDLLTCQDNRFVDNSANKYAITVNTGTPSIQAFSPFVPAYITPTTYSNFFDGSGDYLTAPNSTAFSLPADFTIDCWWYPTDLSASSNVWCLGDSRSANNGLLLYWSSGSGKLLVYRNSATIITSSINTPVNTWYHLAVVRSGSTIALYINGVSAGTVTDTTSFASVAANGFAICAEYAGSYIAGKSACISNLRVLKGTALYTSAFTPPSAPLTAVPGTSLLTCQSSTFIDNSTNNFTITANGNVQPVQSPTPFPPIVDTTTINASYQPVLDGGSYYGDGSGDYLVNNSDNLQVGASTNFTLEFWVYRTSSFTSDQGRCVFAIGSEATNRMQFTLNGSAARIEVYGGTLDFNGGTIPLNAWTHVAFVRTGGSTISIYINGVFATSASWSGVIGNTGGFIFGANRSVSNYIDCPVSGLRLLNGTALYTSNFAPPVAPPTPIANTTLLLNFTNAGIVDDTAKNVLETVADAKISTTVSKYGGSSMVFDGTGDWLISANGRNFINGTEPFTFECWVYITGTPNYWSICGAGSGTFLLTIQNLTTININPYGSGNTLSATTSLSINTWTHIAATRNSANRFDIWVNGVSVGNTTSSQSFGSPTYYAIGAADSGATQPFIGYLNDVRITKACRYFGNFTPPTSSFQNQ
jgi:hypothetical protein